MSPMAASAVVVNFNSGTRLRQCVASLRRYLDLRSGDRIVVVDNASTDGSETAVENQPDVRLLRLAENAGYGAACNEGAAETTTPILLVLNPDVTLLSSVDSVRNLFASHPDIACVAPQVVEEGAQIDSLRPFPTIWSDFFHEVRPEGRRETAVVSSTPRWISGYALGACLFLRTAAFQAVGGFDPAFFLYYEEADLLQRLSWQGYRALFDPRCHVEHESGGSSADLAWRRTALRYHSKFRYFEKHSPGWAFAAHRLLMLAVLSTKLAAAGLKADMRWKRRAYQHAASLYIRGYRPWNPR